MQLDRWVSEAVQSHRRWMDTFGPFTPHPVLEVSDEQLAAPFAELAQRLRENYPFGHPSYAGQMLKPPHPVAMVGYLAAMLINPNNHALDGGPATAAMEKEVVAQLAAMFGLPASPGHLGHLTSSGTIANLEALWVARQTHPSLRIAYSQDAHYTHARMCGLLGVQGQVVSVDAAGRMDLDALAEVLDRGEVGTVVLTAGTTGLGAVDPIDAAVAMCRGHGVRVHVDAAYGGFFTLLARSDDDGDDDGDAGGAGLAPGPWRAIGSADSVVVDPHKHGLQPYGCGAVLFADPDVGRFYGHDSPYTYFTSDELHLGEISLECSRAGAAAAALWLTLQVFPLTPDGLGAVLRPGRRAALRWADLIGGSELLDLYQVPELDIVTYLPRVRPPAGTARASLSALDRASGRVLAAGMADSSAYLATYAVTAASLAERGHQLDPDCESGRVLRSVLMKPEAELTVDALHARVEALAARALGQA